VVAREADPVWKYVGPKNPEGSVHVIWEQGDKLKPATFGRETLRLGGLSTGRDAA